MGIKIGKEQTRQEKHPEFYLLDRQAAELEKEAFKDTRLKEEKCEILNMRKGDKVLIVSQQNWDTKVADALEKEGYKIDENLFVSNQKRHPSWKGIETEIKQTIKNLEQQQRFKQKVVFIKDNSPLDKDKTIIEWKEQIVVPHEQYERGGSDFYTIKRAGTLREYEERLKTFVNENGRIHDNILCTSNYTKQDECTVYVTGYVTKIGDYERTSKPIIVSTNERVPIYVQGNGFRGTPPENCENVELKIPAPPTPITDKLTERQSKILEEMKLEIKTASEKLNSIVISPGINKQAEEMKKEDKKLDNTWDTYL